MIYLQHHDVHVRALAYDPETGTFETLERAALPREPDRGFYVDCGAGVLGLYASPEGPVLFRDDERIPLRSGVRLEVSPGRRRSTFTVSDAGTERLAISYAPPTDAGTSNWSDEEMVDFYVWLAANFPSERFNRYYTSAA